eukprot:2818933-Amphidinium_carterae.1
MSEHSSHVPTPHTYIHSACALKDDGDTHVATSATGILTAADLKRAQNWLELAISSLVCALNMWNGPLKHKMRNVYEHTPVCCSHMVVLPLSLAKLQNTQPQNGPLPLMPTAASCPQRPPLGKIRLEAIPMSLVLIIADVISAQHCRTFGGTNAHNQIHKQPYMQSPS